MMDDDVVQLRKIVLHYRRMVLADRAFIDEIVEMADGKISWCRNNGIDEPKGWIYAKSKAESLRRQHEDLALKFICDMTEVLPKGQTTLVKAGD